jgi:hypothetical protein
MATETVAGSGVATMEKIFIKTAMKSFHNMKRRCFQSAGVPGGSEMLKGDLCWDFSNSDAYICTVDGTTVVKMNV